MMKRILLFLFVILFVVFTYTFLHEGGHALVGVLSGGKITAFSLNFLDLSAHVGLEANFTSGELIANNLAGVSLPLAAWLIFFLLVPRRANLALESLKVFSSLVFLNTLLVWIVFPFLYMAGIAPSDDSTNFLNNSGVFPPLVALVAILLYAGGWALFRARMGGFSAIIRIFQRREDAAWTPAIGRTALSLAGIFIVCGALAFAANGFRLIAAPVNPFQPPLGYTLRVSIDLSAGEHSGEPVYIFNLTRPTKVGIFLLVEGIDTDYIDLVLTGPDQYSRVIVHGEQYTASQDAPRFEATLGPGQYQLVLTSKLSPGLVSIYTFGLD